MNYSPLITRKLYNSKNKLCITPLNRIDINVNRR